MDAEAPRTARQSRRSRRARRPTSPSSPPPAGPATGPDADRTAEQRDDGEVLDDVADHRQHDQTADEASCAARPERRPNQTEQQESVRGQEHEVGHQVPAEQGSIQRIADQPAADHLGPAGDPLGQIEHRPEPRRARRAPERRPPARTGHRSRSERRARRPEPPRRDPTDSVPARPGASREESSSSALGTAPPRCFDILTRVGIRTVHCIVAYRVRLRQGELPFHGRRVPERHAFSHCAPQDDLAARTRGAASVGGVRSRRGGWRRATK